MIVFRCTCDWQWIIDLEDGLVIGPIYMSVFTDPADRPVLTIGNKGTAFTFRYFNDNYSDCYDDLTRKILA